MKKSMLLLALAFSVALGFLASPALAADADITVRSVYHPDRSRTDLQSNLVDGTAESKTYDPKGKLLQRMTYKIDEKGQPIEGNAYSPDGKLLFHFSYKRDNFGRVSEERNSDVDGKLIRRWVYRYDEKGRIAGADAFDAEGRRISGESKTLNKTAAKRSR
ncbi:MAG: hypothetical protein WCP06_10620 [Verrucomicrobiota bacterium]